LFAHHIKSRSTNLNGTARLQQQPQQPQQLPAIRDAITPTLPIPGANNQVALVTERGRSLNSIKYVGLIFSFTIYIHLSTLDLGKIQIIKNSSLFIRFKLFFIWFSLIFKESGISKQKFVKSKTII
jgi:hypothetical protein